MSDYFSDQIATGQPIVPPQATQQTSEVPTPVQSNEFQGLPVRAGGDRVFLIRSAKRHWIQNPQALENLGFTFADVAKIDQQSLDVFAEGEPISG